VAGNLRSPAMEAERGPPARFTDHFDLQPVHSIAYPGAKGLGRGFFGCESGGKALCGVSLPQAIGLFGREIHAIKKTLPETVDNALDTNDLNHVDSGTGDHVTKLQHSAFLVDSKQVPEKKRWKTRTFECLIDEVEEPENTNLGRVHGEGVPKPVKLRSTLLQL
jgi:hypothetical protein